MSRTICTAALLLTACVGKISQPVDNVIPPGAGGGSGATGGGGMGTDDAGRPPSPFACDTAQTVTSLPLERLARTEYVNTLHAFITAAMPQSGDTIYSALSAEIDKVPADIVTPIAGERRGGFSRLDQTVQQATVNQTYSVAVATGAAMTSSTARMTELMGSCATDSNTGNDAACLDAFVTKLGAVAYRHPLLAEEHDLLVQTAGTTPVDPAAVGDVVALMLTMPGFLYRLESGAAQVSTDVYALDAYELAARLAYHFWQGPPDGALLAAASSGDLLTDQGYAQQVDRLFHDAQTQESFDGFFQEWFRLDELGPLDSRNADPVFVAFAGANLPTAGLRQAMFDEVLDSVRYAETNQESLDQLLTDTHNFARSSELAALYGVPAWDGTSAPGQLPAERAGLLTRAAFLSTGTANTRPVMKGLRIRNGLLCDSVPPPPNNANAMPLPLSPDDTTREVLEKLTQQPGTACASCHANMLNPLGFATEDFDSLGRHRATQTLYDATGGVLGSKPVDTTSVPQVPLGNMTHSSGIGDVTTLINQSGKLDSCFARQYFRFTFRRPEDLTADGCALRALDDGARMGSLADALKAAALRPEFKTRRIVQ